MTIWTRQSGFGPRGGNFFQLNSNINGTFVFLYLFPRPSSFCENFCTIFVFYFAAYARNNARFVIHSNVHTCSSTSYVGRHPQIYNNRYQRLYCVDSCLDDREQSQCSKINTYNRTKVYRVTIIYAK